MAIDDSPFIEHQPEAPHDMLNRITRIPRAAQARLLLHGLAADSPFMAALNDTLPDGDSTGVSESLGLAGAIMTTPRLSPPAIKISAATVRWSEPSQ